MKVKIKLISVMLVLTLIPFFSLLVVTNRQTYDLALSSKQDYINSFMVQKAGDVDNVFKDIITSSRQIINDEAVRSFAEASNGSASLSPQFQHNINQTLRHLTQFKQGALKSMIINESGIVVASSSENDIGELIPDYEELAARSLIHSGFSPFIQTRSEESSNTAVSFYVAKSIYNNSNERQGILYQYFSISGIQPYIDNMRIDRHSIVALMDYEGNILEYPFRTFRSYEDNVNFSDALEQIGSIINHDIAAPIDDMVESDSRFPKIFCNQTIYSNNWYIISITHKENAIRDMLGRSSLGIMITIGVICTLLIFICSSAFTRPIEHIVRVIDKKKKGDIGAPFKGKGNDEFRLICDSLNGILYCLIENEQRFRSIVEMSDNITFEINLKKNHVLISGNFNEKFAFRPKNDTYEESFFKNLRLHKDDKFRYDRDFAKIMDVEKVLKGEYRIKNIYGDFGWFMIKGMKFYDRSKKPEKIVGVIVDIDREKKSEMTLLQRANYDALTKIYNRENFLRSLASAIEDSHMNKTLDAVMFIDLDDFKGFNDNYSHACGDEVLKFVADTLKEISFERGFAGRFGGDEFVICLTNLSIFGDAGKVAHDIIKILGDGFDFDHEGTMTHHAVRCSIGIAFLRESGRTVDDVMAAADMAMYDIKKKGKSNFAYAKTVDGLDICNAHINTSTSTIESENREEPSEQAEEE
ncbi:MAG: diguanylate cyclase [Oscillospiraceae bacterium]|nr:diguanylate cyclase [Oscillospiraceae bacterium]